MSINKYVKIKYPIILLLFIIWFFFPPFVNEYFSDYSIIIIINVCFLPIFVSISNIFIFRSLFKKNTAQNISFWQSFKFCFLQILMTGIVITVFATIINSGGFDGMSSIQAILTLVVGVYVYYRSGKYLFLKMFKTTEKYNVIIKGVLIKILIYILIYSFFLIAPLYFLDLHFMD